MQRLLYTVIAALLCAACAATPEATPERDAEAKRFEAASRSAVIYLYRGDFSSPGVTTITVDGRLVGQSLPRTYFRVIAWPGRNRIQATGADAGRLEIQTDDGGVYFVSMHVLGETESSSTTIFRSATPVAGKAAIQRCCTLLETWRPGQPRLMW